MFPNSLDWWKMQAEERFANFLWPYMSQKTAYSMASLIASVLVVVVVLGFPVLIFFLPESVLRWSMVIIFLLVVAGAPTWLRFRNQRTAEVRRRRGIFTSDYPQSGDDNMDGWMM